MIDEDSLASIERLHKMKTDGIINEDDFEQAKADILAGKKRPAARRGTAENEFAELPAVDDHFEWMVRPLKRYTDFSGRSTRREFWMFLLLVNIVSAGLLIFVALDTGPFDNLGPIGTLAAGIWMLGLLGLVVPLVAVEVRRFHDQGRSGFFALLNLIPYIGVWIVFAMMLIPSAEGDNEYGPDPFV